MTKRLWILLVVVALVGAVAIAVVVTHDNSDKKVAGPQPAASPAPTGLSAFYHQKVSWTKCGSAKCATVKVPIDYDKPNGATTKLAVKVIASTSGKATHSMFVNPGGPGGSA